MCVYVCACVRVRVRIYLFINLYTNTHIWMRLQFGTSEKQSQRPVDQVPGIWGGDLA